jgi:hypothetical protein
MTGQNFARIKQELLAESDRDLAEKLHWKQCIKAIDSAVL